jgi:hypothetical protein
MATTSMKIRRQSRRLLQLVTEGTIYQHYLEQQERALEQGKIQRKVPRSKLRAHASEVYGELRSDLRNCESVADYRSVTNSLLKEIGPTKMGFLNATGLSRREALEKLKSED